MGFDQGVGTLREGTGKRVRGAALAVGVVLWSVWLGAVAGNGFDRDVDGNVLGVDQSVFHTAGAMVTSGRGADLYEPAAFREALSDIRGESVSHEFTFLNPPGLAYVFAPSAGLDQRTAWLILSGAGLLAMAGSLRLVGVRPALAATALAVLTFPALLTFRLGQLSFFWALVLGAIYRLLHQDRQVAAGLVAALLVLKPQFAAAVGLWWMVSGTRHRLALATMSVVGGIGTVAAFLWTPGSLAGFWEAGARTLNSSTFPTGFSIKDTVASFGTPLPVVFVALLTLGLGIAALIVVHHRCGDDLPAMFATAAFAAVWLPTHLLAYDWLLLAVAIGALWAARPNQRPQWAAVGAILALWSFAAWAGALVADATLGIRFEPAALGLLMIAWWAYRNLLVAPATVELVTHRTLAVDV